MNDIDRQLLALLQRDSTLSYAELGRRIGLSTSAVNERIKKLERTGAIRSWSVLVNPHAVELSLLAFMLVVLEGNDKTFADRIAAMPEVQECHHITGEFSYLLKIRVRDPEALEEFLMQKLRQIPGFSRTHTIVVLSSTKEEPALPLGGAPEKASRRKRR
jgi:Lrp/AsnC family leucine-responsive transcriptional regulator